VTGPPMAKPRMFCTFRVDDRLFGVDILDVKEVTAETTFTRVAHAPDEVLGLVNIRGHICLALDLHRLLGLPALAVTVDSRLVLFKSSVGHAFGVVVDAIADIRTVDASRTTSDRLRLRAGGRAARRARPPAVPRRDRTGPVRRHLTHPTRPPPEPGSQP
jgi:chemotaxis signal transduction protein